MRRAYLASGVIFGGLAIALLWIVPSQATAPEIEAFRTAFPSLLDALGGADTTRTSPAGLDRLGPLDAPIPLTDVLPTNDDAFHLEERLDAVRARVEAAPGTTDLATYLNSRLDASGIDVSTPGGTVPAPIGGVRNVALTITITRLDVALPVKFIANDAAGSDKAVAIEAQSLETDFTLTAVLPLRFAQNRDGDQELSLATSTAPKVTFGYTGDVDYGDSQDEVNVGAAKTALRGDAHIKRTYEAALNDPDTDGQLTKQEWSTTAREDLFTITEKTTPEQTLTDVALQLVPQLEGLSAPATIDATAAQHVAPPKVQLGELAHFMNVSVVDVLSSVSQVAVMIQAFQDSGAADLGDESLPMLKAHIRDMVQLNEKLTRFFVAHDLADPQDPAGSLQLERVAEDDDLPFETLDDVFEALASPDPRGTPPSACECVSGVRYEPADQAVSKPARVVFNFTLADQGAAALPASFGDIFETIGLRLDDERVTPTGPVPVTFQVPYSYNVVVPGYLSLEAGEKAPAERTHIDRSGFDLSVDLRDGATSQSTQGDIGFLGVTATVNASSGLLDTAGQPHLVHARFAQDVGTQTIAVIADSLDGELDPENGTPGSVAPPLESDVHVGLREVEVRITVSGIDSLSISNLPIKVKWDTFPEGDPQITLDASGTYAQRLLPFAFDPDPLAMRRGLVDGVGLATSELLDLIDRTPGLEERFPLIATGMSDAAAAVNELLDAGDMNDIAKVATLQRLSARWEDALREAFAPMDHPDARNTPDDQSEEERCDRDEECSDGEYISCASDEAAGAPFCIPSGSDFVNAGAVRFDGADGAPAMEYVLDLTLCGVVSDTTGCDVVHPLPKASIAAGLGTGAIGLSSDGAVEPGYRLTVRIPFGFVLRPMTVGLSPNPPTVTDPDDPFGPYIRTAITTRLQLDAVANDVVVAANLGPLPTISIGHADHPASAEIHVAGGFGPATPPVPADRGARIMLDLSGENAPAFDALLPSGCDACFTGSGDATLPVYAGTDHLGTITVDAPNLFDPSGWEVNEEEIDEIVANFIEEVGDLFGWSQLADGVDGLIGLLERALGEDGDGPKIPLLDDLLPDNDPVTNEELQREQDARAATQQRTAAAESGTQRAGSCTPDSSGAASSGVVGKLREYVSKPLRCLQGVVQDLSPAQTRASDESVLEARIRTFINEHVGNAGGLLMSPVTVDVRCSDTSESCPDDPSAVTKAIIRMRVGKANETIELPDFDIGIPGLRLEKKSSSEPDPTGTLGWHVDLGLELGPQGFALLPNDDDEPEAHMSVALNPLNPTESLTAELGFLEVGITDQRLTGTGPELHAEAEQPADVTAVIDVQLEQRTPLSELLTGGSGGTVEVGVDPSVNLDLGIRVQAEGKGLPKILTNLEFVWDPPRLTSAPGSIPDPVIAFRNVGLDVTAFGTDVVAPIVSDIERYTKPLKPVIDVLTAPIPIVSDLQAIVAPSARPLRLLDLMTAANGDLEMVESVIDLLDNVHDIEEIFTQGVVPLPDIPIVGEVGSSSAASRTAQRSEHAIAVNGEPRGLTFPFIEHPETSVARLLFGNDVELVEFDAGTLSAGASISKSWPIPIPGVPLAVRISVTGSARVDGHFRVGYDTRGIRLAAESGRPASLLEGVYLHDLRDGVEVPEIQLTGTLGAGASLDAFVIEVGLRGGLEATMRFDLRDGGIPQLDIPGVADGKVHFGEISELAAFDPACIFDITGQLDAFLKAFVKLGVCPFCTEFSTTLVRATLSKFDATTDYCIEGVKKARDRVPHLATQSTRPKRIVVTPGQPAQDLNVLVLNTGPFERDRNFPLDADGNQIPKPDERFVVRQIGRGKVSVTGFGLYQEFPEPGRPPIDAIYANMGTGLDVLAVEPGVKLSDSAAGEEIDVAVEHVDIAVPVVACGGSGIDVIGVVGSPSVQARTHIHGDGSDTLAPRGTDGDPFTCSDDAAEPGADHLRGGAWTDHIIGGGGDDSINGNGGSDTLRGGDGDDVISGGGGVDFLFGDKGADTLRGGPGLQPPNAIDDRADTIRGGPGNDQISGDWGDDHLYGDGDDDTITDQLGVGDMDGGTGNDHLYGGPEADTLRGGDGDDVIEGAQKGDAIEGGSGNDQLFGEGGSDVIDGNDGFDILVGGLDDSVSATGRARRPRKLVIGDTLRGGTGPDLIVGDVADIRPPPGDTSFTDPCAVPEGGEFPVCAPIDAEVREENRSDGADRIWGDGGRWHSTVLASHHQSDVIFGQGNRDVIRGMYGEDEIHGGPGNDTLYGDEHPDDWGTRSDADGIYGDEGDDDIYAGADADVAYGGDGTDEIYGDNGNDVLYGDAGPDTVDGQRHSDEIHGGLDDDRLLGGDHHDEINGDEGDDRITGNGGADYPVHGDAGNDQIAGGDAEFISLVDGVYTMVAVANSSDSTDVLFGDSGRDRLRGQESADTIRGGTGRDSLWGDAGSDKLEGGSGHDILDGGSGHDRLFGLTEETTDDVVQFSDAVDRANAGVEGEGDDDTLSGGTGSDCLKGGPLNDDLFGGGDTDLLEGSEENDILVGGGSLEVSDGADYLFGGIGADTIAGDNARIDRGPSAGVEYTTTTKLEDGSPKRNVLLLDRTSQTRNAGRDRLLGGQGIDHLYGQGNDDMITGGANDDYMEGNQNGDPLYGDRLYGDRHPHQTDTDVEFEDHMLSALESASASDVIKHLHDCMSSETMRDGSYAVPGQDDQVGGSSLSSMSDRGDKIFGDGAADAQVGDNGALRRTLGPSGAYQLDDDSTTVSRTAVRLNVTTRPSRGGPKWGGDRMEGGPGDDKQWGGSGNDTMFGQSGHDDMFGELGDDTIDGGEGHDGMVGDRGSIVRRFINGEAGEPEPMTVTVQTASKDTFTYTAFENGSIDRRFDLSRENGNALASPGTTHGGDDEMQGGPDDDRMHGGFGNDLMNGNGEADHMFGGDGGDAMWGGPSEEADQRADILFGGYGGENDDTNDADLLDYIPRGGTDPQSWMDITTDFDNRGRDFLYGGWNRDVLQGSYVPSFFVDLDGNVTPFNDGDGDWLVDWQGNYNLYMHLCNADVWGNIYVSQFDEFIAPQIEALAFAAGAGLQASEVSTRGTSAYRELALVRQGDLSANSQPKGFYPSRRNFAEPACPREGDTGTTWTDTGGGSMSPS